MILGTDQKKKPQNKTLTTLLSADKPNDSPTGCSLQLGRKFPSTTSICNIPIKEENKSITFFTEAFAICSCQLTHDLSPCQYIPEAQF